MRKILIACALLLTACANTVIESGEQDADLPAECAVSSDCPEPPPESCRTVACDWTGNRTDEGLPRGCFLVVKVPNSYCYFQVGPYTCPGTCSGAESGSVCQNMTPHCGDYH